MHHQPHIVLLFTHFLSPTLLIPIPNAIVATITRQRSSVQLFSASSFSFPYFSPRFPSSNAQRAVIHRRREAFLAQKLAQTLRLVLLPHYHQPAPPSTP